MQLWDKFKEHICNDLQWQLTQLGFPDASLVSLFNYGLYLIQSMLKWDSNKTMKDIGMQDPMHNWQVLLSNSFMQDHVHFEPQEEHRLLLTNLPLLNSQQKPVFNCILHATLGSESAVFYLMGAASAGKTFLYKTLCHELWSHGMVVLCVAYLGIAAKLLAGGRTTHLMFKIPFNLLEDSICSIPKSSLLAKFLKMVHLIIWDECSAQNHHTFEVVDCSLQDIHDNNSLFGGILCVLGGNYLQTLPVVHWGSCSDIIHACLLSSPLWSKIRCNVLCLETNMCVDSNEDDQVFVIWLHELTRAELKLTTWSSSLNGSFIYRTVSRS